MRPGEGLIAGVLRALDVGERGGAGDGRSSPRRGGLGRPLADGSCALSWPLGSSSPAHVPAARSAPRSLLRCEHTSGPAIEFGEGGPHCGRIRGRHRPERWRHRPFDHTGCLLGGHEAVTRIPHERLQEPRVVSGVAHPTPQHGAVSWSQLSHPLPPACWHAGPSASTGTAGAGAAQSAPRSARAASASRVYLRRPAAPSAVRRSASESA